MINVSITTNKEVYFVAFTDSEFGIFDLSMIGPVLVESRGNGIDIIQFDSISECYQTIVDQLNQKFEGKPFTVGDIQKHFYIENNIIYKFKKCLEEVGAALMFTRNDRT